MAKMTEIYTCKQGQELKAAQLYTSPDAMTKAQAEVDAREKCQADHTIAKIAYFIVDEGGNDKHLYTYKTPDVMVAKKRQAPPKTATKAPAKAPSAPQATKPSPQPKRSAPSLLSRVVSWALTDEADDGKPAAKKTTGPKDTGPMDDDIEAADNTKAKASKPKKKQPSMLSRVVSAALTEDVKK